MNMIDTSFYVEEPSRRLPVVYEADICVVGGSCTGVFAAVRAARLGATVAIIENMGFFGGVATQACVNVWHSIYDSGHERQIIAGLTLEVIERLKKRSAVEEKSPNTPGQVQFAFNPANLAIELDELVRESSIKPFLHARFCAPSVDGDELKAVVIEDKSGRRAIRAKQFIDATGDGDLVSRMGWPMRTHEQLQPPTMVGFIRGLKELRERNPTVNLAEEVFNSKYPNALPKGFFWEAPVPGSGGHVTMVAGTRVYHVNCSDAEDLTFAEMEGRKQVRDMVDIFRENFRGGEEVGLVFLPAKLGTRESRHAECLHELSEHEVLNGVCFDDGIANSCYRVDIHHTSTGGNTFRWLDGREFVTMPGRPTKAGRWREEREEDPTFFQIPYRSLVPKGSRNVLVAGRVMDADMVAFSAARVMQNCNQTGEAAGVAAYLALCGNLEVAEVCPVRLRECLAEGGSIML